VAAGILLIREAGGTVEPLAEGADLLTGPVDLVAGNPEIFKALKALLRANQAV
jgi:fructose-1,6-bisphosphatase/inositol monophosphatase family enzyme